MKTSHFLMMRARSVALGGALLASLLGLAACSNLLDVDLPGRIPAEQLDNAALADVLTSSVVGDFECAYNDYFSVNSIHSDEYETSNGNVPLSNYGERNIGADEDDYATGQCDNSDFGIQVPLHTARYQSEDIFTRLSNWTDADVPSRTSKMATVKAYGAYTYLFFGETFCSIAFDGGAAQTPAQSLAIAETRFNEAITLAQSAGNTDILNMALVGLARTEMDLKKWSEAAQAAAQVPAGYTKLVDRGNENLRRWNKLYYFATESGAYVIADGLRAIDDPRLLIEDTHSPAFTPSVDLWINTKYTARNSPIRLASYIEAQLILAEAQAQQGHVTEALQILNTRRAQLQLPPLTASSPEEALSRVLDERRVELSFEGGHRLNDILRYHIPWKGTFGSTQTTNPYSGRPYGSLVCWPLPTKETNGA